MYITPCVGAAHAAIDAIRASHEACIARSEVDRLDWLLARQTEYLEECISDCMARGLDEEEDTNCCFRRTWTEWFKTIGYFEEMAQADATHDQLIEAESTLRSTLRLAKIATKKAYLLGAIRSRDLTTTLIDHPSHQTVRPAPRVVLLEHSDDRAPEIYPHF